ncbi:hypothetical protein NITHO_770003 [Nitrolancea hollandica Lb]|uniref:Uncharacterized protein n=1 Tax=Nitrolancea hollandica Lb TaxID=1129897 RepID=I4EN83_9BACT|nr:hypothetical protein NITHO_770003 [Nitrolancea hollandica Lb]
MAKVSGCPTDYRLQPSRGGKPTALTERSQLNLAGDGTHSLFARSSPAVAKGKHDGGPPCYVLMQPASAGFGF